MKYLIAIFCIGIISCGTAPKGNEAKQYQCTKYACPMHSDNTSTHADLCPECKMKMVAVDSIPMIDSTAKSN
ncbi:MAG TPA: heavy metal-binding domain-containing protein [Bacteroidia bacterium]